MKTCTQCDGKHHAKGYCKIHYKEFVLDSKKLNQLCSIDGCNNNVGKNGFNGLCSKHYTRVRRNGDALIAGKNRQFYSLQEFFNTNDTDTILDTVFESRVRWAFAVKLYYGDKCCKCGWAETSCDADHIIPFESGGPNTIRNGQVLCPNHHAIKHRPSTSS